MEKYIPYEKLSKKEKRKADTARRNTWGDLNPVTRKPQNSKAYCRNKARSWKREIHETNSGTFLLPAQPKLCYNDQKAKEVIAMTFLELAKARYSVRSFKDLPITEEHMNQILEAGHVAPTACNNQPQKIYIAKSEDARKKLASVCRCTFDAPVILVVCYDRTRDWKNKLQPGYESGETDAAIVCTHMMLEAAELGIGSCWVGYFNADRVSEVLGLPENVTVSALLPMGYPADDAKPLPLHAQYRSLDDIASVI